MSPNRGTRLYHLVEREFRQLTNKPAPIAPARNFKLIKLRLTAVLLREDDTALERRVCESGDSARTHGPRTSAALSSAPTDRTQIDGGPWPRTVAIDCGLRPSSSP
jgi:hypothetical protein